MKSLLMLKVRISQSSLLSERTSSGS